MRLRGLPWVVLDSLAQVVQELASSDHSVILTALYQAQTLPTVTGVNTRNVGSVRFWDIHIFEDAFELPTRGHIFLVMTPDSS